MANCRLMCRSVCLVLVVSLLMTAFGRSATAAVDSIFTYQGQLKESGLPASGSYDIRFTLHDAAAGGAQVGGVECRDNVSVQDGQFTVLLDFGAAAFDGSDRWVEIAVRADSAPGNCNSGSLTTLSPRQRVTATPYAQHALFAEASGAPWATTGSNIEFTTGNVAIGRDKVFGFEVLSSFLYDAKQMGHYALGWFGDTWNEFGATAWLSGYSGIKFFTYGQPVMAITQAGNVGIGTDAPEAKLDVRGEVRLSGNVGIGTTAPQAKLDVRGDIRLGGAGDLFAVASKVNNTMVAARIRHGTEGWAVFDNPHVTVEHLGPGHYRVFFPPFPGPPLVMVTPSVQGPRFVSVVNDNNNFNAEIFISNQAAALTDTNFNFVAIGFR